MGAVAMGIVRGSLAGAAAAALLLVGTSCGERREPTGTQVSYYPVTVQGAGERPVHLAAEPRRIIAVADGPTRILGALGVGRRLIGSARTLAPNGTIRLGLLARLHPDLIVAATSTDSLELAHAGARTGTPVYVAPDDSLREVERSITDLGLLAGEPLAARRLVEAIEAKRHAVTARERGAPPVTVFVDTGFFVTVPDRSLIGDLIRQAGGRNVAGPNFDPGPFDLGALARLDPEVYVATSESGTTLTDLRHNRRARRLRSVRSGRFALIPTQFLQAGPLVGDGLEALARALHPNAFR